MAEPAPQLPQTDTPAFAAADVISLAEVAARRAKKFGQLIDTLDAGVAKRAAEAADSLTRAGFDAKDQQAAADKAAAMARREVVANSSGARWERLRELQAASDTLAMTAMLWASPVTVLSRAGLGTPERTAYLTQLEGSGVVELRNMAALATATKNKVLGAALVTIIDKIPARSRPFSSAELSERLCGEEWRQVDTAIREVREAARRSIMRNREYEAGKVRPLDRVKLALNKKEA